MGQRESNVNRDDAKRGGRFRPIIMDIRCFRAYTPSPCVFIDARRGLFRLRYADATRRVPDGTNVVMSWTVHGKEFSRFSGGTMAQRLAAKNAAIAGLRNVQKP